MSIIQGVPLRLSSTKPDFEALVLQIQLYLNQKDTWKDRVISGTGQTFVEIMSAIGAFNQFGIESAAREAFMVAAIRDSSIYAITRMLGVRISRKTPSSVNATLSRIGTSGTLTLPKYTQFDINGTLFFNREVIVFNNGSATANPAVLYEGQVHTQTFVADSQAFREIYLNEPGFGVSDQDLEVILVNPTTEDSELWARTEEGIWIAEATEKVYYDNTSATGDTILAFGDGTHGVLPPVGYNIIVNYVVTKGAESLSGISGLQIKGLTQQTISGVTTSAINLGANEKPSSYYKALASNLYRARTRAVTQPDYKSIVSSYPGVASATIQAQKDIAPNDLRWMNVVRICILPTNSNNFTELEWQNFLNWFATKQHAAIHIQKYNPTKLLATVKLTVAMTSTAVAVEVTALVTENIQSLFAKNLYTLGKRIAISDIIEACTSIAGVDYVDVDLPTSDFVCPSPLHYYALQTLTVSTIYSERNIYSTPTFS
jgi:hypothetical protein